MSKEKQQSRYIKPKNKYKLWVDNNGECNFCSKELLTITSDEKNIKSMSNVGEIAHIVSFSKNNQVRNNKNKKHIIDNRFENCPTNKDHEKYWNNNEKKYTDDAINCQCNLILLCSYCHQAFDSCIQNNRINDEKVNKAILDFKNISTNEKSFEEIYKFVDENIKIKKTRKSIFVKPLIAISKKDNEKNILFNNVNEVLEIVRESNDNARINILPYKKDLYFFKEIYSSFYKDFNFKKIKDCDWNYFSQSVYQIINEGFVLEFSFNDLNGEKCWYISFEKDDLYDISCEIKDFDKLRTNIEKFSESNKYLSKNIYNQNTSNSDDFFIDRPEFEIISNILIRELQSVVKNKIKEFNSFSIAYFARWGTGKTSLIRTITRKLSDFYNCIEINLWNISNLVSDKLNNNDDSFVRHIVKEAITQLIRNPYYVKMYVDSNKNFCETNNILDLKNEMLNSLIGFDNVENIDVFVQRSKFIDEFILNIQSVVTTIFDLTLKPTIFVFDDIDRINDSEKIIRILDSIVTFLSLKNCVFIFPVDESKIIKAINETKPDCEPLLYINKYFNYSVNSSSIPNLEVVPALKEQLKKIETFPFNNKENDIKDEFIKKIGEFIEPSFRTIKDFSNNFSFILYSFSKNIEQSDGIKYFSETIFNKNTNEYNNFIYLLSIVSTLIHLKYPLIIDLVSENIDNLRLLISFLKKISFNINDRKLWLRQIKEFKENDFDLNLTIKLIHSITMCKDSYLYTNDENEYEKITSKEEEENKTHNNIFNIEIKIKKLWSIFNEFEIFDMNDDQIILLWLALTLSRIKNENFINFMKVSIVPKILTNIDLLRNFSLNDEWELKIINFFSDIDIFNKNNFIKKEEMNNAILSLFKSEIFNYIKEKFNMNNLNKFSNINKLPNYLLSIILCNDEREIEQQYVEMLINCCSTFNISYLEKRKILIDIENFEKIINSLHNSQIFNFLNNNDIEIFNNSDKKIYCNTTVSIETFEIINNIVEKNIQYNAMPKPIIYNENFIKNINLIKNESIEWIELIKVNKKHKSIKNMIETLNNYKIESLVNFIAINFESIRKVLSVEEIFEVIEIEISTDCIIVDDYIKNLLNILVILYKQKNKPDSKKLLKIIADKSIILDKNFNENTWFNFLENISYQPEKNIIANIICFFKENNFNSTNNNPKTKFIYYLLEGTLKFSNNDFILKNKENIISLDEMFRSNQLKKICSEKISKFIEEFAYDKMEFQEGANMKDIFKYNMVWNKKPELIDVQLKIICDYIIENKTSLWNIYNEYRNNSNFICFLDNAHNQLIIKDQNNVFDPLYIISKENQTIDVYSNKHFNKCKVSFFKKLKNIDAIDGFSTWYSQKCIYLKKLEKNAKKYSTNINYHLTLEEFENKYGKYIEN